MDRDEVLALSDLPTRLWDLGGDAVFAAREFLTVAAVADGRAGLFVGVVERDFITNLAAVAAAWDGMAHFVGRRTMLLDLVWLEV